MMFDRFRRKPNEPAKEQPMARRTVHVMVRGRVQGVGYRAWTQRQATARGLSGWVCNRRDGAVEAVFSGNNDAVAAMLVAVHSGPRGSRVDDVTVNEHQGAQTGAFVVRETY